MKATGIVRRIDDLGRVVIPKEIRRTMRIREGEPLEIYTDKGGEVIFKKYSPIGEVGMFTAQYAESITKSSGLAVAICDKDSIVAISGAPKKDYLERPVSPALSELMEKRQNYASDTNSLSAPRITENSEGTISYFSPIVADGTVVGGVMSIKQDDSKTPDETEKKLISTGAIFLSKQIEF